MKWAILITARLKSKRFKKKVLKKLNSQFTIIEYLIRNLERLKKNLFVITSYNKGDDYLCKFLKRKKIKYFKGPPLDVLKRIYLCAYKHNIANVISVTADNPFIDLNSIKKMMNFHIRKKMDFTYSRGLPLGLFGYCININSLKKILQNKKRKKTEIWGGYFLKNKNIKSKGVLFQRYKRLRKYRFTIDYREDLEFCKKTLILFNKKYPKINFPGAKELNKLDLKGISKININKKQTSFPIKYI